MNEFKASYDVAIIGGGVSGLAASIYSAKAGLSVLLVEKANQLGGRALTVKKNGAYLNLGVHAFYLGGAGEAVVKELDVELKGAKPPASVAVVWNNQVFTLPTSPLQLITAKLFSLSGKAELVRFMTKLGKIDTTKLSRVSFREWAEREIRDPMIRHVVYAICRTNTFVPHPDLQLASVTVKQLQRTFAGNVLYLDKGWSSLVDDLKRRAEHAGVTIMTGRSVAEITRSDNSLQVRFADGEPIMVPSVIVAAGPGDAHKLVKDAEQTRLVRWKEQAHTIKTACLDLILRRLPKPEQSFVAGFWLDAPIFYNNPTFVAKHSDVGDSVVIHMVKQLGENSSDPKEDERQLEQALDVMQPGWRKEEIARQFLPSITAANDFCSIDKNGSYPGPDVPEIAGLYVAGDWAGHGETLVDASLASARRAAQAVIKRHEAGDWGD